MSPPEVSVLMPAFNAAEHLSEAIESVLAQTFTNFELVVIDDGSTDATSAVLEHRAATDSRIRVIRNPGNLGLIETLNRGLEACRAPLVARMDADDICDELRLERQVAFMGARPDIDIVGGAIRFFGNVPAPHVFTFPTTHEEIRPAMLFYCPLAHPALMFRRSLVERGLFRYDNAFRHAEDYHLWSRLLLQVRAANVPDLVLHYRLHRKQVSSGLSDRQYEASLRVRSLMLEEAGLRPLPADVALHESVILERPQNSTDYLDALADWFGRIEAANARSLYWDSAALHKLLKLKFNEVRKRVGVPTPAAPSPGARYAIGDAEEMPCPANVECPPVRLPWLRGPLRRGLRMIARRVLYRGQ